VSSDFCCGLWLQLINPLLVLEQCGSNPDSIYSPLSDHISLNLGRIEKNKVDSRPRDSQETFCLLRFLLRPLTAIDQSPTRIRAMWFKPRLNSSPLSDRISLNLDRIKKNKVDSRPRDSLETFCLLRFLLRPFVAIDQSPTRIRAMWFKPRLNSSPLSDRISLNLGRIEKNKVDSRPRDSQETFCLLRFLLRPFVAIDQSPTRIRAMWFKPRLNSSPLSDRISPLLGRIEKNKNDSRPRFTQNFLSPQIFVAAFRCNSSIPYSY
jgi:hypothetical protein